jgi:3-oxoacyl-[acyl-carrier protein] reductase
MTVGLDLEGRVAVVTGGTRGIGLAIVRRLAECGAEVIATGTSAEAPPALTDLADEGFSIEFVRLDLADEESTSSFAARIRAREELDILVNNAGINQIVEVDLIEPADYDRLHRVNLRGPLILSGAAVAPMRRKGWGRIVNIASIWATITKPGRAMYAASKFGLVGLSKTLAVENARFGILVNAVSPGFTLTELTASTLSAEEIERLAAQVPADRFADPGEMANVVAFLCSPLNTYLTAQNITVDGGFTSI